MDKKEWSTDWRKFSSNDSWRVQRRDGGEASLVAPGFHVTLDKGMEYKEAEPIPVKGPFTMSHHNGYIIGIQDGEGRIVANIELPNNFRSHKMSEQLSSDEESLWVFNIVLEALNKADEENKNK